ncbi:MAG TPA: tRNA preQ1(34) S-adenosylmethionine ribosyltransferase-isomerase QueA [Blastocatellia bacterium]|nr:tRNA preQ1(34) S-adenosylmethionine ribosyltransferase-isomerase QueA [Blastocatellia bacterium]
MLVSDFDYELPEALIAQEPAARRERSRLLVVDRAERTFTDSIFERLPDYLRSGDVLVLNNTRVFPARLIGRRLRETPRGEIILGGHAEVFLVTQLEPMVWEALVRPGKSLLPGARVEFARGKLACEVLHWREFGRRIIRFETDGDFDEIIDRIGRTPLPPYIKRDEEDRLDAERYQTVYASERGAVAAPTAGLHFTRELLDLLGERGVEIAEITLHVGYGTFQPVRVERVEDHHVEPERYSISEEAARTINRALEENRRVIAVGTTTTRALESAALESPHHQVAASPHPVTTDLFIYPGFEFRVISGLVTNFHLPESSLLMLVSAFGSREFVLEAYRHAVKNEYHFYSYGDAMLIL